MDQERSPIDLSQLPVLVLAGGESSRMGMLKGLLPWGEKHPGGPKTWLEFQLVRLAECGLSRALIVLGHRYKDYLEVFPWLGVEGACPITDEKFRCSSVVNHHPALGQFSSLQAGVKALAEVVPGKIPGAFVLPIDVPCADPVVWAALARALGENVQTEACMPHLGMRGGHPVLLGNRLLARILETDLSAPDARLDLLLHEIPKDRLVVVPVADSRIRMNINTPEDWETIRG